ncbi:hypothetical protein Tco_0335054 [Tanacetum coccineum]
MTRIGRDPKVNKSKLVSKYASLWPGYLLLSIDFYNALSLRRHYKLGILVGASCTQGTVSNIPIVGIIIPEGFLTPILLLVVIIVTVVIVAVILVIVVVVAIVGVVIVVAVIGVVVVVGGWAYAFHQDKASSVRVPVANVTLFSSAHLLREALQVRDTGCRLFLVAGPLFLQFLGASCIQRTVSSIPIVGLISLEGFLTPILLLVVIIVAVILVIVVVVAIVGVVIVVAVISVVVVVGGVSFIIKLSFVII